MAVETCLTDAIVHGAERQPLSEVAATLTSAAPEELACRRDRVARALADFDAATIATTANHMIRELIVFFIISVLPLLDWERY